MAEQQTVHDIIGHLDAAKVLAETLLETTPEAAYEAWTSDELTHLAATAPADSIVRLMTTVDGPLTLVPRSGRVILDGQGYGITKLTTSGPASHYMVQNFDCPSIILGLGDETDPNEQPDDITLDGLTVIGDPAGQKRGITLHTRQSAVLRTVVRGMRLVDQDSQAIWINNGPGPYTIADCILEGAGENLLTGGDRIPCGVCPSDILIERVRLEKPREWQSENWQIKNSLELKVGKRVTIRQVTIDNCWAEAQTGYAVLLTQKDQYGDCPFVCVEDVLIEDMVMANVSSGFSIDSTGSTHPTEGMCNITLRRVHVTTDKALNGGDGRFAKVGSPVPGLTMEDCTGLNTGSSAVYFYNNDKTDGVYRRNWWRQNSYGFYLAGSGVGNKALAETAIFEANTIVGGKASDYPAGTLFEGEPPPPPSAAWPTRTGRRPRRLA